MKLITNDMDMIDSRDIIDRVEEIESNIEDRISDVDEVEELRELRKIVEQVSDCGDFEYGEGLIREDYFTEYCQELCEDTGDIPSELPWYIENHIDWEGVAREMKQDCIEVDFDGVNYFMRA